MSLSKRQRRRYRGPVTPGLAAGVIAGIALHAAGIFWIGATWRFPAPPAAEPTFVISHPDSREGRDYAELLDPSPLFLPTALNHGTAARTEGAPAPEDPPIPITPKSEPAPKRAIVSRTRAQAEPTAEGAAGAAIPDPLAAFRLKIPAAPAGGRARCEIAAEGTDTPVRASALEALPRDARDLPPAEFLLVADAYGLQPPTLLRSCGDTAADAALADALVRSLAAKPLPEGRYHAVAAP